MTPKFWEGADGARESSKNVCQLLLKCVETEKQRGRSLREEQACLVRGSAPPEGESMFLRNERARFLTTPKKWLPQRLWSLDYGQLSFQSLGLLRGPVVSEHKPYLTLEELCYSSTPTFSSLDASLPVSLSLGLSLCLCLSVSLTPALFGVGRVVLLVKKAESKVANNRAALGLARRPPDPLSSIFSSYHIVFGINQRILVLLAFIDLKKLDPALCKIIQLPTWCDWEEDGLSLMTEFYCQ